MRTATTTETHQALGITPCAPWRVLNLKIERCYRLQVTFMDGSTGSHESTDNIPGRDVIRRLQYGAFIVRGIDTH